MGIGFADLPSSSDGAPPRARIALGANAQGMPAQMGAALDRFRDQSGRAPAIAMYYQDFYPGWQTALVDPDVVNPIYARGAIPMITWEPWIADRKTFQQPDFTLRKITAGRYDDYLRRAATEVRTLNRPVFIRFAHEMNGSWFPWGRGINHNTPVDYRQAWRHVVRLFRDEGATKVRWVWSPNISGDGGQPDFSKYFPGDRYVDWVGLDGYNRGGLGEARWKSFAKVFAPSYRVATKLSRRPIMIAETGSTNRGGSKAKWIREGLGRVLPRAMPRIRALVWFDRVKETDWRIDSSPSTLRAFRGTVRSKLFGVSAAQLARVGRSSP